MQLFGILCTVPSKTILLLELKQWINIMELINAMWLLFRDFQYCRYLILHLIIKLLFKQLWLKILLDIPIIIAHLVIKIQFGHLQLSWNSYPLACKYKLINFNTEFSLFQRTCFQLFSMNIKLDTIWTNLDILRHILMLKMQTQISTSFHSLCQRLLPHHCRFISLWILILYKLYLLTVL